MERLGDPRQVSKKAVWHAHPRAAWPADLPGGREGSWDGWSAKPDVSSTWNASKREVVMHVLEAQYAASGLDAPQSLSSLSHSDCRAVTVGHQLVLAGGPAFFHHKILTAIRMARGLAKTSGQPVVPVFWMASEDHDWKEIATIHGASQGHAWVPSQPAVPHPVGSLGLKGVGEVLEAWMADGLDEATARHMRADAEAAIAAGETWSGLMRRWLHRWYGEDGLLVLDPQDAPLKTLGAALWAKEFGGGGVYAALQGSTAMDGPAHVRENSVFWIDATQGRKGVIRTEDGRWKAGDIVLDEPTEGWLSWASENAMSCSPGVLLRPLYQELLLQSAAVILGPGEWGYWHQLPRAFAHHGLTFPALRLRDHGVVVSAEAVACGWTLKDGWLHDEVWDRWVLDKWMSGFAKEIQMQEQALAQWNQDVQAWASDISPELKGPAGALEASTAKAWKQWMAKVRKSLKGSRAREWASARRACATLMRAGVPQDRWANWHVLAGGRAEAWKAQWLSETDELKSLVWVLEDQNE